jgi:hypothetical protein
MLCRLITIYDVKVIINWTGTGPEGAEARGSLTIPEVSHEVTDGLSDYVVRVLSQLCCTPGLITLTYAVCTCVRIA